MFLVCFLDLKFAPTHDPDDGELQTQHTRLMTRLEQNRPDMPTTAPLSRQAMAYVLAGGRGSRLMELTDVRAKPAVYFGGKFRIVDFALSNALNSGIRRIAVATQYKAHSLIRHLQRGWNFFRPERNETFDILPASQRVSELNWYMGTADAVYQNLDITQDYNTRFMIVMAGDHIYKMDFEPMLRQHVEQGADVTVACIEVARAQASGFGVMSVDATDRIIDFLEKPADPPEMPGRPGMCLASMGIYVFDTKFLAEELRRDAADANSSHDFGSDIIPRLVREAKAVAHPFSRSCIRSTPGGPAYWRDVGTIDSYFAANIDLTEVVPDLDLYDRAWPVWTYSEMNAPAKFVHDYPGRRGSAVASLVAGGCVVSGATVWRSLLFNGVRVNSYSAVELAVVLPDVEIGRSARLRNVIIDRGVRIPENLVVGEDPVIDAQRFRRSEGGVCLITQKMIDKLGG
jgi:glucose-1-phosphate adenylyltransferase